MSLRAIFERFLTDGRIELDSNSVERAIGPQAITRKNSLIAGSDGGGRSWATIATLLQTAKMNNVDPVAWFTQTLERIDNAWPRAKSTHSCRGTTPPERPRLVAYEGITAQAKLVQLHQPQIFSLIAISASSIAMPIADS